MLKEDIVRGLAAERTALAAYLRAPGAPAADGPTLCDGWVVRDVVAHLVGNCADVVAGNLDGVGSDAYNQRQIDERAAKSLAEMLTEWEEVGPAAETFYESITPEFWATEMPRLGTIGLGVTRHLYDLWTHVNDILIPHGSRPAAGLGARAALDIMALELPRRLPKTLPTVGSLTLIFDDVKEQIVIGDGDEVVVTGDLNTFLLLCVGREDLAVALSEGRIAFEPMPPGDVSAGLNIYGR